MNYDATVEFAGRKAREEGWVYLQDTTAPDYFEIPGWIMEGYTLMADEAVGQVLSLDSALPTHIFFATRCRIYGCCRIELHD
jgi:diaminopropionate ammonia-lyase